MLKKEEFEILDIVSKLAKQSETSRHLILNSIIQTVADIHNDPNFKGSREGPVLREGDFELLKLKED